MLALLLLACLSDRTLLDVPVTLTPSPAELSLDEGVSLRLDSATVSVEALRVDGPHVHASLLGIRAAYAHPGHASAGEVVGELLGPWTLDLIGEPVSLGEAQLYEGEAASAWVRLLAEPGARLQGAVSVDGERHDLDLAFAESIEITEIPFAHTLSADAPPAGLRLEVDLAHALSFISWVDSDGDGLITEADDEVAEALAFGISATPTWTLTLEN